MKYVNLDNVQEAGDFNRLTPGGYICGITRVEDVPEKEYLKIEYDIAEGEFRNYFRQLSERFGFWGGRFIRSYKDSALPFFRSFTKAVERSNKGYEFDYDEHKLVRKYIGLVLGEEEYISKDGEIKTRLYVASTRSVDAIKQGDFKVPELKKFKQKEPVNNQPELDNSDLPF